jgi:hypothetical protein
VAARQSLAKCVPRQRLGTSCCFFVKCCYSLS